MNDLPRPHQRPDHRSEQQTSPWSPPRLPLGTPATTGTAGTAGRPTTSAATTAQDERLARLAARRTGASGTGAAGNGGRHGSAGPGRDAARPAPSGRSHPAGRARASALALSVTTTVGLAAYLHETGAVSASTADGSTAVISGSVATTATTNADTTATTTAGTAETAAATEATTAVTDATTATTATTAATAATEVAVSSSGLVDGTYTGDTASTKWGPVQVAITVSGGQITSVDVLQYPADDHKSVSINQRALPTLISDTLTAQSADVDTVSGATYTSDGYRASLQTAIDDARAAATAG